MTRWCNRANDACCAGNALVVKGAAEPDLAVSDAKRENPRADIARLAPHAFVANFGDFANCGCSNWDYDNAVSFNVGGDF